MPREVTCPKCGGTQKIQCTSCWGKGGEEKTYAGETKWYPCTYCNGTGSVRCDNGCVWGKVTVWD